MSKSAAGKSDAKGAKSDTDAIKSGVAKVSVNDKKKQASDDEEEEDEDEEDEEDDGMGNLPKKVLKRVVAIRKIHTSVEEIDIEYKKERIALEQKYLALKRPLYDARDQIVSGEVEPPVDESEPADASENADEGEDDEDIDGVPGFWLQCLGAHHVTGDLIAEEDVPALEALTSIKCDYDETFSSFTLTFHFAENDFFTNKVLTKKYGVSPDLLDEKAPALTSNEGTEIDWKPTKNLTVTEIKKKQKAKSGRNKGQVRTVVETVPKASFFHFFSTPTGDEEDKEENQDEDDEDGHNRIKLSMEEDYDVGHTIRTAIIPEAVLWYTGEAVDDDDEDYDEDGLYGEEGGDDDDEEEEEESDDEDDKKKKTNNKKNKIVNTAEGGFAAAPGAPTGGEQPECKQN